MSDTPKDEETADSGLPGTTCSRLFEAELRVMPKALRLLAGQITAPDHVPAMCLRDAASMIESLKSQRNALRCEVVTLRVAAQGVIDRWDTPLWKDVPATAKFINRLRSALSSENIRAKWHAINQANQRNTRPSNKEPVKIQVVPTF